MMKINSNWRALLIGFLEITCFATLMSFGLSLVMIVGTSIKFFAKHNALNGFNYMPIFTLTFKYVFIAIIIIAIIYHLALLGLYLWMCFRYKK